MTNHGFSAINPPLQDRDMLPNAKDLLARHSLDILDAIPEGVFVTNLEGITLYVNRMYEQLTGLSRHQVLGRQVRTLVEEGVFDVALNPEVVRKSKTVTHTQRLRNGKMLVLTGTPVFDESGALRLVITFARDITRISQLNEQISEQKQLIEQTNEQMAYMAREQSLTTTPVFASKVMRETLSFLQTMAKTDATLLILGETGVGKDVFARYVHGQSQRCDKVMMKVDCGSISESLVESEMFGYMAGAFTGASSKGKAGYFELAKGSTIFLDEIGEMPLTMQTRLLRVLQDGEIMRIGGNKPVKVDARIIAATNRDLVSSIEEGKFRQDLFYRLNVATVKIPPLRERRADIPLLAETFLRQYSLRYHKQIAFMDITLETLTHYHWPGNVRELENLVHSLVITHEGPLIAPADLPPSIHGKKTETAEDYKEFLQGERSLKEIMAEIESDFLNRAIRHHGSVQQVARIFKINRSTIFRKINKK
ncbi:PAS domain S-box-containing protein [Desulfobotulus alkaliphilus]|uniref:PAS domain S-box-containing protein n=1 Tax=Desulfobotulus alkaliphilus TaxID=622671 RepID=A0A562RXG4_9BACT|nr:sigma 54-interacting transcriptional regulator [Desulfobotulus alkaliphilus]TWI73006.1 PAS domain S-box-containing protein [Desulfobotulus alkaliphilus]